MAPMPAYQTQPQLKMHIDEIEQVAIANSVKLSDKA